MYSSHFLREITKFQNSEELNFIYKVKNEFHIYFTSVKNSVQILLK